jgi:hypothetical protein
VTSAALAQRLRQPESEPDQYSCPGGKRDEAGSAYVPEGGAMNHTALVRNSRSTRNREQARWGAIADVKNHISSRKTCSRTRYSFAHRQFSLLRKRTMFWTLAVLRSEFITSDVFELPSDAINDLHRESAFCLAPDDEVAR